MEFMINLILSWFSFIIFVSYFQELTQLQYFFYSSCMFGLIYLNNFIYFTQISSKVTFLVFTKPSLIFFYAIFVYNDFLSLTPIKYKTTYISLFFFYLYAIIFIICK